MDERDRKRFALTIGVLGETFGRIVTKVTIRAYEIGLEGLPIESVDAAVHRAIAECKFMPVPADLRALAGELSVADRSVISWKAVLNAMLAHDFYHSVDFDDPAVNAAIRSMGGWMRLSERYDSEQEQWLFKEFDRAYQVYCRRGVTAVEGAPLGGYFERVNQQSRNPARIVTTLIPTRVMGPRRPKAITAQPPAIDVSSIGTMPESAP